MSLLPPSDEFPAAPSCPAGWPGASGACGASRTSGASGASGSPVGASHHVNALLTDTTGRKPRRRGVVALVASLSVVTIVAVGALGATAAFAASASPTTVPDAAALVSTTAPADPSHAVLRGELRRELRVDVRQGTDFASRAQNIAKTLVGHPKLFAKLPTALQTDLTALSTATGDAVATDATAIKTKALAGGYGSRVQAFAEKVQSRASSGS